MAITPTGAIYKTLNFDGQSSGTYGVYITGDAVFNAPEREVEMVTIPGRNGAFALDLGRFENIEVTYPAGIFAETEADFAEAISDFRNYLCSRKGYCRLTDDYNPEEYRLGIYKSGLDVDPALLKAGQFNITFDCKPQRFLLSGETEQTIAQSGDTLTNPTLFDSNPLLSIKGYGTIALNSQEIEVDPKFVGDIQLAGPSNVGFDSLIYSSQLLLTNDSITAYRPRMSILCNFNGVQSISNFAYIIDQQQTTGNISISFNSSAKKITIIWQDQVFANGNNTTYFDEISFSATVTKSGVTSTATLSVRLVIRNDSRYAPRCEFDIGLGTWWNDVSFNLSGTTDVRIDSLVGYSTQTALGNPTYIDCDIGEAYKYVDGEPVSLNSYIDLGSALPVFSPGTNTITYDNTVTELKITPRWWKV